MRNFTLLALGCLAAICLQAQTYTPIAVSGFNHDLFAESGSDASAVTDTVLDATNHIMYTEAFAAANGLTAGLPDNGIITDGGGTRQYQLAAYNGANALTLLRNVTRGLSINTPSTYTRLSLLAFSAEGASNINVSLQFTDGSSSVYLTGYALSDWFFATGNVVISGFGRIARLTAPPYTADGIPSNPRFYYIDITLTCTDAAKSLSGVTVSNVSTTGANPFPNAALIAVSGVSQSQSVTSSSTPATCGQANGTGTLTVTGNSGPYTYSWAGTSPVQTGATATGLAAGSYTVTLTNGAGCSSSHTVSVPTGAGTATASASANPATICSGGTSQLTVTLASGTIASALWNPGALSGATVSVTPIATTPYTVTGTDNNGCTFSTSVTVTVQPSTAPPAPLAQGASICAGNSATLTVQNPNILYTYSWFAAATGGTALANGLSYTTPALTANTTYYLQANLPCISSPRTPVTVTVNPTAPVPTAAGASICSGATTTLTVQNPQPGITYGWFADASGSTLLASGNSFTSPALTATTTYYLGATAGPCFPSGLNAVIVSVTPAPAAPTAPPASTCSGNAAALFVQGADPALSYRWYDVASGGTVLSSNISYTTPALSANTTYYVAAVTSGGCTSTRTPVPVTVIPAPVLPAANDVVICINSPATLTVLNPQTGVTYEWYSAPNAGTLLFTGAVVTTPPLSIVTTYYLEARIGTCIMGRPAVQVTFLAQLQAPVVAGTVAGNTATFTWNAVAGAVGYEVSRDGGSTWTAPSSGATGLTHIVNGLQPGTPLVLQVRALAADPCANSAPGSATLLAGIDDVFVPNVFTPNGDGRNDLLLVYGSSLLAIEFRVWDQWGNEVFKSTDAKTGWDGTYRGQRAPVGVYVFALKATLTDGRAISKKGSVNLLR